MEGLADLFTEPTAAEQTGRIIADSLAGARGVLRASLENVERMIWQNPYGLTPQQTFDVLGTKAVALLQLKAAMLPMLDAAFPGEKIDRLKPENLTIRMNEDGTVTIVG